jgi:hypothetical protein
MTDFGVFYLYSNHTPGSNDFIDLSSSDHVVTSNTVGAQNISHYSFLDENIISDAGGNVSDNRYGMLTRILFTSGDKTSAELENSPYLSVVTSEDFNFETGDFTIEWRANIYTHSEYNTPATIFSLGTKTDSVLRLDFIPEAAAAGFGMSDDGYYLTVNGSGDSVPNFSSAFNHYALVRSGNSLLFFVNGQFCLSSAIDVTGLSFSDSDNGLTIGAGHAGEISDFRITKGSALWTNNFIPPEISYAGYDPEEDTSLSQTGVLCISSDTTDGDTTVTDCSIREHTISNTGITHSIDQAKFGATSLCFDGGIGHYLSIDSSLSFDFGINPFAIDFWLFIESSSNVGGILSLGKSLGRLKIELIGDQIKVIIPRYHPGKDSESEIYLMSESFSINTWHHVSVYVWWWCQKGLIAIDGEFHDVSSSRFDTPDWYARKYNIAPLNTFDENNGLWIGKTVNDYNMFTGYLDEIRIVKEPDVNYPDSLLISNNALLGDYLFTPLAIPYSEMEGEDTPGAVTPLGDENVTSEVIEPAGITDVYQLEVVISSAKIDNNLENFPVKIWLDSSKIGRLIFDTLGSTPSKMIVTKADQTTSLYVEIEEWDHINGKGVIWVSGADFVVNKNFNTVLYILFDPDQAINEDVGYVGDVPNVWRSETILQYNFADAPNVAGACLDSTENVNNGSLNETLENMHTNSPYGGKGWLLKHDASDPQSLTISGLGASVAGPYVSIKIIAKIEPPNLEGVAVELVSGEIECLSGDEPYQAFFCLYGDKFYLNTYASSIYYRSNFSLIGEQYHTFFINQRQNESGSFETTFYIDNVLINQSTEFPRVRDINTLNLYRMSVCEVSIYNAPVGLSWMKASYYNSLGQLVTIGNEDSESGAPEGTTYKVAGTVKQEGILVERRIFLHRAVDGMLMATTTSVDGVFEITGLQTNDQMYIVAMDAAETPDYNDLIYRVIPIEE